MYKVCHGTQYNCRCLEDKEQNCKWLALLHASLLNHMTLIITKVEASYIDHMNDDALEVDSFSLDVTRLSPPPVSEERAWGRGYGVEG